MSTLEVNKITPSTGTDITLGDSGDTFTLPSGVTLTNNGTASGFGKIGQVVNTVNTTEYLTQSSSYSDITGLSLSITPSATSSKILVMLQMNNRVSNGAGTNANATVQLLRGSTSLQEMAYFAQLAIGNGNPDSLIYSGSHTYLDSPSTTSQITYKYQAKSNSNFRAYVKNLILMEVLA